MTRTTITLDPDVEQLLRDAMQERRQSFKEVLNQAVRSSLRRTDASGDQAPFVVRPRRMGLRAGIDPSGLNQLSDDLEVDAFLHLSRRLAETARPKRRRKSA